MINKLLDNCFLTELNTRVEEVREENGMYSALLQGYHFLSRQGRHGR